MKLKYFLTGFLLPFIALLLFTAATPLCFGALADGINTYFKFDDASGTTANEEINGYDGTITNAAWATGKINGCLYFDGNGDYVLADYLSLYTTSLTICFWGYLDGDYTGVLGGIGNTNSTTKKGYMIYIDGRGYNWFNWGTEDTWRVTDPGPSTFTVNAWHYFSYTIDSDWTIEYIDGVEFMRETYGHKSPVPRNDAAFNIGATDDPTDTTPANYFYKGYIDELATWNVVKSAADILLLYNSGNGNQYPFSGETIQGKPKTTRSVGGILW